MWSAMVSQMLALLLWSLCSWSLFLSTNPSGIIYYLKKYAIGILKSRCFIKYCVENKTMLTTTCLRNEGDDNGLVRVYARKDTPSAIANRLTTLTQQVFLDDKQVFLQH